MVPTSSHATTTAFEDCGTGPRLVRPTTFTLACADDNERAIDVKWASWTSSEAAGTGLVTWNVCSPDCADSNKWDKSAASFVLTSATTVGAKGELFEKLVVDVTGYIPPSFPDFMRHQTFPENPV